MQRQLKDPLRIVPVSVQAQTVEKLRDAILTGVFEPGERLVETDLCQRMGISRPSVRQALRCLEAERLVTIIPNRGPFVTEVRWEEALQIYHVRALLEGEAAALFAARATPAELEALSQALADFEKAVEDDDPIGRLAATSRFYDAILNGCGNSIVAQILGSLVARINFLRAKSMSRAGRSRQSAQELREIAAAIQAGDAQGARTAAVHHVHAASESARALYGQVEKEKSDAARRS